jgi:hypothetical protein
MRKTLGFSKCEEDSRFEKMRKRHKVQADVKKKRGFGRWEEDTRFQQM